MAATWFPVRVLPLPICLVAWQPADSVVCALDCSNFLGLLCFEPIVILFSLQKCLFRCMPAPNDAPKWRFSIAFVFQHPKASAHLASPRSGWRATASRCSTARTPSSSRTWRTKSPRKCKCPPSTRCSTLAPALCSCGHRRAWLCMMCSRRGNGVALLDPPPHYLQVWRVVTSSSFCVVFWINFSLARSSTIMVVKTRTAIAPLRSAQWHSDCPSEVSPPGSLKGAQCHQDHLCSEISFPDTSYIPNLTSFIYRLKRFTGYASAWLHTCMRTETHVRSV